MAAAHFSHCFTTPTTCRQSKPWNIAQGSDGTADRSAPLGIDKTQLKHVLASLAATEETTGHAPAQIPGKLSDTGHQSGQGSMSMGKIICQRTTLQVAGDLVTFPASVT
jgi:hypothetical protein